MSDGRVFAFGETPEDAVQLAAHDLLEACKAALDGFENGRMGGSLPHEEANRLIDKLSAAIAKAEPNKAENKQ
jgi:hypothetical protein